MFETNKTLIIKSFNRYIILTLMMLWVPAALYLDIALFEHRVPEDGATELTQEFMIGLSALIFTVLAVKNPGQRGFYILVAGLFWSMLTRELDHEMDQLAHGLWKWPVTFIVIGALALAYRYRSSIVSEMARVTLSLSFNMILTGLVILLFFSRVFGTGSLWTPILDASGFEASASLIKSAVQEGVELLGYTLIFYGTVWFAKSRARPSSQDATPDHEV